MKHIILSAVVILQISFASCQTGRKIEIDIHGIQDTMLYLVHYYGNSNSIMDTAYRDRSGKYAFQGKTLLPEGVYILVDQSKSKPYFEFLIDNKQHFKIKTDTVDLYGNLSFSQSPVNSAFKEYSGFVMDQRKKTEIIRTELARLKEEGGEKDLEQIAKLEAEIKSIDQQVKARQKEIVAADPKSMLAVLLKLQWDPEHPYDLKNGTREDSLNAFYYTKNHYWDHVDFTDDRNVRTPIFHEKLKSYITVLVVQHPDSVIAAGEDIIAQTVSAPELFKFVVWYIVNTTERSNIMGMDKAFVHFAENYYLAGKTWWVNDAVIKKMSERVRALKRVLLGAKAPELQMWDTSKRVTSLHQVQAEYTILLFWDYECGHCKKVMPQLLKYYHEMQDQGVKVFAVCTKTDLDKWKNYLIEHNLDWINVNGGYSVNRYDTLYDILSTPIMFLLDREKKIIAKRVELDQLRQILQIEMDRTRNEQGILRED